MRSPERPTRNKLVAAAALAVTLFMTGCGSDADPTSEAPSTDVASDPTTSAVDDEALPTETTSAEVDQSLEIPERVVSLSPTHTEIMFAIGAGEMLVAVDEFSNYPAEALALPNELSGFEPNIEAIAAFEPDLVLIGGDFNGLGDQLSALDIVSWDGPAATTIEDTYAQIDQLGVLTGNVDQATAVVTSMQTRLEELVDGVPDVESPLEVYHEVDDTLFSADSTTFIGEVYSAFGLQNVADRAEGESFGFPQLNAESIISADPDLIFVPCGSFCTTTAAEVAARPGWDSISAVSNGDIIEADEDIASRWGPRIVDYYATVAAAIDQVVAGA